MILYHSGFKYQRVIRCITSQWNPKLAGDCFSHVSAAHYPWMVCCLGIREGAVGLQQLMRRTQQ